MGESSGNLDVEKLLSYCDDLVEVLKDKRDMNSLSQILDHTRSLQSSCDADHNQVLSSIEDYQKKIEACKQKTERAKSEITELDHLQNELEKELEHEQEQDRALVDDLRVISNEINDLEQQRISIEERKRALEKIKQDELWAEKKLSMYASVTNIIPDLNDQSKISGYIVDSRDKKLIEKFEYDPAKMTDFDICNSIWKKINP